MSLEALAVAAVVSVFLVAVTAIIVTNLVIFAMIGEINRKLPGGPAHSVLRVPSGQDVPHLRRVPAPLSEGESPPVGDSSSSPVARSRCSSSR